MMLILKPTTLLQQASIVFENHQIQYVLNHPVQAHQEVRFSNQTKKKKKKETDD
jgi:hypothetical protein